MDDKETVFVLRGINAKEVSVFNDNKRRERMIMEVNVSVRCFKCSSTEGVEWSER